MNPHALSTNPFTDTLLLSAPEPGGRSLFVWLWFMFVAIALAEGLWVAWASWRVTQHERRKRG